MLSIREPPQNNRSTQAERKGMEKILHTNGDEGNAGVAIRPFIKQTSKQRP